MAEGKTDPVCGQSIDPLRAGGVAIVAGERYYFCSLEHRELFAGDPARYIAALRPAPEEVVMEVVPAAMSPAPVIAAHLVRFEIGGMEGADDAERVRKAVLRVDGVVDAAIDRVTEVATLTIQPGVFKAGALVEAVATAGFEAAPRSTRTRRGVAGDLLLGGAAAALLVAVAAGGWWYTVGLAALAGLVPLLRWLERYARQAAQSEVGALEPLPEVDVRPGDVVRASAPELVLVDGVIRSGEAVIDETAAGGAGDVERDAGDPVVAGTRVVRGSVVVDVRRTGGDRAMDRLRAAVVELAVSPSALGRLARRLERWAPWAAVGGGALVFAMQLLLGRGLGAAAGALAGALVALGPLPAALAVAPALAIAGARAARRGVLFRNAEALERAAGVRVVVVDRGAVLAGRREIDGLHPAADVDERQLLALAAAAEGGREGPLARALRAHADERGVLVPPIDEFRATPGRGVTAIVAGKSVAVGSRRLAEAEGADPAELEALAARIGGRASAVYVLAEKKLAGIIGVSNRARPGARELVNTLKERGVRVALVSGDEPPAAAALAEEVGIEDVQAGLGNDAKKRAIADLRAHGPVAVVGDSVDEAAALAAADVGIAVARGAALELAAGGVTVLRGDLGGVLTALTLARHAARTLSLGLALVMAQAAVALGALALFPWGAAAAPLACLAVAALVGAIVLGAAELRRW